MHGWEWVWMTLWLIGVLIFTIAIITLLARRTPTTLHHNAALDTLAQRYARGEIDDEEFVRRREIMRAVQPHLARTRTSY